MSCIGGFCCSGGMVSTLEIIYTILSFLLGTFVVYITAYSKSKGKNKALKEDIARLEDEKQSVIAKYQAETEELKKKHTLDIEKRKHQYSEKKEQFVKFFSLIDEFHGKCNSVFAEKFPPMMNEFLSVYLNGNEDDQALANVKFMEQMQILFNELNKELLKVKSETNTIRIISSKAMDSCLDKLEVAVETATNDATKMLKFMATPEFWADQSLLAPYQEKSARSGHAVTADRDAVRELMKVELNEI
jgi:hypothetical protein